MNTTLALTGVASVQRLADVRHTLRRWLANEVAAESIGLVELVATEMITNAVIHGGGFGVPSAEFRDGVVRIEVRDHSTVLPQMRDPGPGSASGRGMRIIAATSERWGVELDDDGKTVWSEIHVDRTEYHVHAAAQARTGGSSPTRRWAWADHSETGDPW